MIIADGVRLRIEALKAEWGWLSTFSPMLVLDDSWPSVGVLDLITFGARGDQLNDNSRALIKSAAAYLAQLAGKAWEEGLCQAQITDEQNGIVLRSYSSEFLAPETVLEIKVEEALIEIFTEIGNPIRILDSFERFVPPNYNFLSLFAIGLVTGISSYSSCNWQVNDKNYFKEVQQNIIKHLARSTADYYKKVFPLDSLGQVAELYFTSLIYPPASVGEDFPGVRSVRAVHQFCADYGIGNAALRKTAVNLTLFPDELISSVGCALAGALIKNEPPIELIAACEAKGTYMGVARWAKNTASELFLNQTDWFNQEPNSPGRLEKIELEQQLGFLPWIKLSSRRLLSVKKNSLLGEALELLMKFEWEGGIRTLGRIESENPHDCEVRVQSAYLQLIGGQLEEADRSLALAASEPGAENNSTLFNIWGLCRMSQGDTVGAGKNFKRALKNAELNSLEYYQAANNLAWSYLERDDLSKALDIVDIALNERTFPMAARLNKFGILLGLKRNSQADQIRHELLKINPVDRKVFSTLLSG